MFGRDDNDSHNNTDGGHGSNSDAAALDTSAAAAASDSEVTTGTQGFIATPAAPTTVAPAGRDLPSPSTPGDLLSIKQEALQQLSPLVSHLNQTPEEKFRTTMMMIQATDDQTLITGAYEAAKAIADDKTRAQALLDIINEINYFTQQQAAA